MKSTVHAQIEKREKRGVSVSVKDRGERVSNKKNEI